MLMAFVNFDSANMIMIPISLAMESIKFDRSERGSNASSRIAANRPDRTGLRRHHLAVLRATVVGIAVTGSIALFFWPEPFYELVGGIFQ